MWLGLQPPRWRGEIMAWAWRVEVEKRGWIQDPFWRRSLWDLVRDEIHGG